MRILKGMKLKRRVLQWFETRTFGDANARIDTRDEENVRLLAGRK